MKKLFENLNVGDTVILSNRVQRKLVTVRLKNNTTVILENGRKFDIITGKAKDGSLNRIEPYFTTREQNVKKLKQTKWSDISDNVLTKVINILQLC